MAAPWCAKVVSPGPRLVSVGHGRARRRECVLRVLMKGPHLFSRAMPLRGYDTMVDFRKLNFIAFTMCDDQAFRDKITDSHESRFARAYHRCTGESVGELLVLRLVVGGGLVFGSTACVGSTAPDQPTDRRERSEDIDRRRCHDRGSREQSPTVCTGIGVVFDTRKGSFRYKNSLDLPRGAQRRAGGSPESGSYWV